LMAEAPNAFNDVVLTFLDEIDRTAAASAQEIAGQLRAGLVRDGCRRGEVMLAPPGDLVAAERAHRQAAPPDQHAVLAAARADRPVGERDVVAVAVVECQMVYVERGGLRPREAGLYELAVAVPAVDAAGRELDHHVVGPAAHVRVEIRREPRVDPTHEPRPGRHRVQLDRCTSPSTSVR